MIVQPPSNSRSVVASYLNAYGKRRWIIAEYLCQFEREAEYADDCATEYNEADDTYYIARGWYEIIENWDAYGFVAVVEGEIDCWWELPKPRSSLVERVLNVLSLFSWG